MARKRTGTLVYRAAQGWCAQATRVQDGETIREWHVLDTHSKPAAKIKLRRIVAKIAAGEVVAPQDAARAELLSESIERVMDERIADGVVSAKDQRSRLRKFAVPDLGHLEVTKIETSQINETLAACKRAGMSKQTVQHLKQELRTVFAALKREGVIKVNPVDDAELPTFPAEGVKERETVPDDLFAAYLAYQHPQEHWRMAVLEGQTMACISRMFGGLRSGDLHRLKWEIFDTEEGRFAWGWAPRKKTKRPQLLEVPELLRPFIRDWWERHGRPAAGLIFPARRGERAGEEKRHVSHARALRRDLRRAFGIEVWDPNARKKTDRKHKSRGAFVVAREPTARERALLEGTEYTERVDFHSFRRAYSQGLADADVNAQQATALAGHASLAAHARYLHSTGKMRSAPAAALPQIGVRILHQPIATANRNSQPPSAHLGPEVPAPGFAEIDENRWLLASGAPVTPEAAGSSPVRPADFVGEFLEGSNETQPPVAIDRPWFAVAAELAALAVKMPAGALDGLVGAGR